MVPVLPGMHRRDGRSVAVALATSLVLRVLGTQSASVRRMPRVQPERPWPMATAVEREYRPGTEQITEIRCHVDQLFVARGANRPNQSRVGNHDGSTEEGNIHFEEDVSVPLDPPPHGPAAKQSELNALHQLQ